MVGSSEEDDFREGSQSAINKGSLLGAPHGWIVPVLGGEQWGGHHSATSGFSSSPGYRKARLSR